MLENPPRANATTSASARRCGCHNIECFFAGVEQVLQHTVYGAQDLLDMLGRANMRYDGSTHESIMSGLVQRVSEQVYNVAAPRLYTELDTL